MLRTDGVTRAHARRQSGSDVPVLLVELAWTAWLWRIEALLVAPSLVLIALFARELGLDPLRVSRSYLELASKHTKR